MRTVLLIVQLVISSILIALVLLQAKGVGLGKAWGGAGEFYKSRRGVEKFIFQFTIIVASLFLIFSILNLVIS